MEFEGGWAAPSWPAEYGGRGFGPVEYAVWAEQKARVGANIPFNVAGFGMAGLEMSSRRILDRPRS